MRFFYTLVPEARWRIVGENINRFAGSEGKRDGPIFFAALRASLTRLRRVARSLRSQKKIITSGTQGNFSKTLHSYYLHLEYQKYKIKRGDHLARFHATEL